KTSDIKRLPVKIVKPGENVTIECNISGVKEKNNLVWYKQSFGNMPQFLARPYKNNLRYKFAEAFENSQFNITLNDHKFDLHINEIRKEDNGDYFCGGLEGTELKFTSGARLKFEGEKPKLCSTLGTLNQNTQSFTILGLNTSDSK
ncbi:putative immune-type receptor 7 precursor, partial [Clarias magur]